MNKSSRISLSICHDNPTNGFKSETSQYLIYYLLGTKFIQPMGIFTGRILQTFKEITPYCFRRSNGQIFWRRYNPLDPIQRKNYIYLSENQNNLSLSLSIRKDTYLMITLTRSNGSVFVYGEMYVGFSFQQPSILEMRGRVFLCTKQPKSSTMFWIENPIDSDCIVEIQSGQLVIFVCDHRNIVLLPDDNSLIVVKTIAKK